MLQPGDEHKRHSYLHVALGLRGIVLALLSPRIAHPYPMALSSISCIFMLKPAVEESGALAGGVYPMPVRRYGKLTSGMGICAKDVACDGPSY